MNLHMQLLLIVGLTIAETILALQIKIENQLTDNLEIWYISQQGFVADKLPRGSFVTVTSDSDRFWGPVQFTYKNTTYRLRYTQAEGWQFQLMDASTKKHLLTEPAPYVTLHDAELVGFVIVPSKEGAKIQLNTSVPAETLQHIDRQIEGLQHSLQEVFPTTL